MFNEDSILSIRVFCCDLMGGGGGETKIAAEKIKATFLIFSAQFLLPIEGPRNFCYQSRVRAIFVTNRGSCDDLD